MNALIRIKTEGEIQELSLTTNFSKLFSDLDHCSEVEQKVIIEEIIDTIHSMNREEFYSIFKREMFNRMNKMIEEKKISMENALFLSKCFGHFKKTNDMWINEFYDSLLNEKFEKMIFAEDSKKEEKNEKILVDLCECHIMLHDSVHINRQLLPIILPCLLKASLNKEENNEAQKEVETALLALSEVIGYFKVGQELYLNKTMEIIKYHQKHRNLTQLAYQYVWRFLLNRVANDRTLEEFITNDLHFAKEAARELNDLFKCVDWKSEREEENEKRRTEVKEKFIFDRWLDTVLLFFFVFKLLNEEIVGLIRCLVTLFIATREKENKIFLKYIKLFQAMVRNTTVSFDILLKEGVFDLILENIQQSTFEDNFVCNCLRFFATISKRLKENAGNENEEAKRIEMKRKIFEKIEEEGYEDYLTSFHETFRFLNGKCYPYLSLIFSDYFVNT